MIEVTAGWELYLLLAAMFTLRCSGALMQTWVARGPEHDPSVLPVRRG